MRSERSAEAGKVRNSCRMLKVFGISEAEDIEGLSPLKSAHILLTSHSGGVAVEGKTLKK